MNTLFIDVPNMVAGNKIFNRLKALSSTHYVSRPINYFYGTIQRECKITVCTDKTEEELDAWLYRSSGIDYIGCGVAT